MRWNVELLTTLAALGLLVLVLLASLWLVDRFRSCFWLWATFGGAAKPISLAAQPQS
jgi:hypothetical protein